MLSELSSTRNAQRQERLRDLMVSKIAKLVEHGAARRELVSKQRRQSSDGIGGTLGGLSDQEIGFIRAEVDRLIHCGDASEASLNRIATQVRIAEKGCLPSPRYQARSSDNPNSILPSLNASRQEIIESPACTLTSTKEIYAEDNVDPWALLCEKEKEEFSKEVIALRRANRRKEAEQKEFLDKQIQERNDTRRRMIEQERDRAREDQRQAKIYEEQAQKTKNQLRKKHDLEKRLFEEQLLQANAKKAQEAQLRKKEEQRAAIEAQKAILEEKKALAEKKIAVRQEVSRLAQINFVNKDKYRMEKQKEADEDAHLQKMFLERLSKEEKAREEHLAKLHERMARQTEMAHSIQKTMQEKSIEDERKAMQYAAEKEAKELATQRIVEERRATEKMKLRQSLALQILEKEKRLEQQRADDQEFKSAFNKEVAAAQKAEIERRIAEKERVGNQKSLLDQQMKMRSSQRHIVMSEAERQFNSKRLESIVKDRV